MNTNTIMRNRNLTQGSVLYKIRELQRERWCRNIGTWGSRHALRASSFFTPVVVSTVPRLISHRRQNCCSDVWRRSFTRFTQAQEVTSVGCYCCCCKREREKTIGIQPPIDQSNAKEKKPPGSVISIDLCMWSHSEINVSYATKEHTIATTPADQCDKLKPCEFAAASREKARERARVIEGETIEETRKAQRKPEGEGKAREGVCSYRKPGPWLTARDGTGYSPWVCPRCQRKYC
jgi:hypothetical protein